MEHAWKRPKERDRYDIAGGGTGTFSAMRAKAFRLCRFLDRTVTSWLSADPSYFRTARLRSLPFTHFRIRRGPLSDQRRICLAPLWLSLWTMEMRQVFGLQAGKWAKG